MSLADIMTGLGNALATISGLRVYPFPADRIETPAAILNLPETPYDVTLSSRADEWTLPTWVLVAKADDKAAFSEMVGYLDAEGIKSVRGAVDADYTLGGACDTAQVTHAKPMYITVAGTEYLAVEFTVEVFGHGTGTPPAPPAPALTWLPLAPFLINGATPVAADPPVYAIVTDSRGDFILFDGKIQTALSGLVFTTTGFPRQFGNSGVQYMNWAAAIDPVTHITICGVIVSQSLYLGYDAGVFSNNAIADLSGYCVSLLP